MFKILEGKSLNTKEYDKYILNEIIKHSPLRPGKLIEVKIIEGHTPLPEITEIPIKPTGKEMILTDVAGKQIGRAYKGLDSQRTITAQILDKEQRKDSKFGAIWDYTTFRFAEMFTLQTGDIADGTPLNATLAFIVKSPEKIYREAQKLGLSTHEQSNLPTKEKSTAPRTLPNIYYNKNTGVGYVNNKRFKFKNDQPEFTVFLEMYADIGKPVSKKRILELARYQENEDNKINHLYKNVKRKNSTSVSATYFLNELAKKMRKRTGLTPDHLVNNNGDLTLVGEKLETSPK